MDAHNRRLCERRLWHSTLIERERERERERETERETGVYMVKFLNYTSGPVNTCEITDLKQQSWHKSLSKAAKKLKDESLMSCATFFLFPTLGIKG